MDGLLCKTVCAMPSTARCGCRLALATGTSVYYLNRIVHPMCAICQAVFVRPAENPRPTTAFAFPLLPRYDAPITTRAKERADARKHALLATCGLVEGIGLR